MADRNYWVTIIVKADDAVRAEMLAQKAAAHAGGEVLQVDPEPPQGSLIVGDYSY
jgi:hypothetical protein